MTGDTNQKKAAEVEEPTGTNPEVDNDFEDTDGSDLFTEAEETDSDEGEEEPEEDEDLDDAEDETEEDEDDADADDKKPADQKGDKSKAPDTSVKNLLKVTYLGKEEEIDPMSDRAKELIQKGMNHDLLSAQLAEQNKVLTEYGKMNGGLNAADALKTLVSAVNAATVEQTIAEIKKEYPDVNDKIIKELAESRVKDKALTLKQTADATEEQKQLTDLQLEYPKIVKLDDLPKEVLDAVKSGKTPLMAMKDHEITGLKKEVSDLKADAEAAKKNLTNRDRALGSAKGTAGKSPKDDFIAGAGL